MTALVKCNEFAMLAGVSKAAISKACQPGKTLYAARVGERLDMAHPVAVAYLEKQSGKPTTVTIPVPIAPPAPTAPPPPKRKTGPKPVSSRKAPPARPAAEPPPPPVDTRDPTDQIPENIRAFLDWTLAKLIRQFGTETAFNDWLKATKLIEEIQARQLDNATSRGELVARQLVKVAIIDPIDETHRRLLADGTKNIAHSVATMAKAGRSAEDIEAKVSDIISSHLKPMKDRVARAMKQMTQNDGK